MGFAVGEKQKRCCVRKRQGLMDVIIKFQLFVFGGSEDEDMKRQENGQH
jgi:hypothetical protein